MYLNCIKLKNCQKKILSCILQLFPRQIKETLSSSLELFNHIDIDMDYTEPSKIKLYSQPWLKLFLIVIPSKQRAKVTERKVLDIHRGASVS